MRKPVKTAAVLFGLGVGASVGPSLGPAALWSGVAVAAASDHRAEAKRECEEIVAAARQEAEAILSRAHDQATGITDDERERDSGQPT
ncbi:hypothetical protein [Micromonospora sp. B9E7]|uniref:hypothetical protein n=1 Tax=Micromonospora sp. B9E7 TaxID=3153574 RepID=UPI00325E242A